MGPVDRGYVQVLQIGMTLKDLHPGPGLRRQECGLGAAAAVIPQRYGFHLDPCFGVEVWFVLEECRRYIGTELWWQPESTSENF